MRGFKLISFGEFSYMCSGKECAEFQVLCTKDKPEPVSGWLHECNPSECKIWRGLSRAENRELSKTAPNIRMGKIADKVEFAMEAVTGGYYQKAFGVLRNCIRQLRHA
jgi:hypothetical protein